MQKNKFRPSNTRKAVGREVSALGERVLTLYGELKTYGADLEDGKMSNECPSHDMPDHADLEALADKVRLDWLPQLAKVKTALEAVESVSLEMAGASKEEYNKRKKGGTAGNGTL